MQSLGGVTEPVGAQKRPDGMGIGQKTLYCRVGVPLREDHRRALFCGIPGKIVPIAGGAAQAHKRPSRFHTAGITGQPRDLGIRPAARHTRHKL